MQRDFIVNITKLTKGVAERGFGTILILDTSKDSEYKTYADLQSLAPDFAVSTDVYKIANRIFGQPIAPIQIAVVGKLIEPVSGELTTLVELLNSVAHKDFYFLVCTRNEVEVIKLLSSWIDSQEKMYFSTIKDLTIPSTLESEQTVTMYHEGEDAHVSEGLASYLATAPVGGVTAKFKTINGVLESNITQAELNQLHEDNGFSYVRKGGVLQTSEGMTTSGEYIDVVMGGHWIKFRMEEELMLLTVQNPKIPYSNEGIAMLVSACDTVLKRAVAQGIILEEQGVGVYNIEYMLREDTPKNDIANRKYNGIKWTATLAGAIHGGIISGQLIL